jgi:hypothetical protein
MKSSISSLFLLLFFFCSQAQNAEQDTIDMDTVLIPRFTVFAEIGGSAFTYSANFEYFFTNKRTVNLNFRAGIGGYFLEYLTGKNIGVPLLVNGLIGRKKSKLEIGAGVLTIWNFNNEWRKEFKENVEKGEPNPKGYERVLSAIPSLNFAYRHQTNYGLFWRVAFTPVIINRGRNLSPFIPWLGVSCGYFFGYRKY